MYPTYPTMEEVEQADHEQIAKWFRFLPSPGIKSAGRENFQTVLDKEVEILNKICERLKSFGGMTTKISKRIGWR